MTTTDLLKSGLSFKKKKQKRIKPVHLAYALSTNPKQANFTALS